MVCWENILLEEGFSRYPPNAVKHDRGGTCFEERMDS
jgi:hypothetical protein